MLCGQPRTTPLWLNSHVAPPASPRNGAQAAVDTGIPTVAERTAADQRRGLHRPREVEERRVGPHRVVAPVQRRT